MKRLPVFLGLLAMFATAGCLNDTRSGKRGNAEIQIRLEKIGAMQKVGAGAAIEMQNLILILRSPGEITRRDTIPLSGNSQQTILKTYANLSSLRTWTLEGTARDLGGITVYRDSVKFTVPAEGTAEISLNLRAIYSMLVASFYPIRDSVTRCQLWVDGALVSDSTFPRQSLLGDTVKLTRDYVLATPAGREALIRMDVYGDWFGEKNILLYQGEATITVYSGRDTSYSVTLFRVGPPAPIGQAKINVTLGAVGKTTLNGYMDDRTWSYLEIPGISQGPVTATALTLDNSEFPIVAYSDVTNESKLSVMKWNGAGWASVGPAGFSPGVASQVRVALDPEENPVVAFQDLANGNKLTVMRWSGVEWEYLGSPGFSDFPVSNLTMVFAGSTPYVAFSEGETGGAIGVLRWNGTAWQPIQSPGLLASGQTTGWLAMVPHADAPYIAFKDSAHGGKVSVSKWNGSAWEAVGSAGVSAEAVDHITLAVSQSGYPYVGFRYGNRPSVLRWDGTSWQPVGSHAFSPGYLPNFELGLHGETAYVSFPDGTRESKNTVMRWNDRIWEIVGTPGFSETDTYLTSLAISKTGQPFVSFREGGNGGKLAVMRFTEACCTGYIGGGLAKPSAR